MIEHPGLLHVGVPHVSAEGGPETAVTREAREDRAIHTRGGGR